jgi:hypothetical protein
VTDATILTLDGISHGMPTQGRRVSGFVIETTCGQEFSSWRYKEKCYGIWFPNEIPSTLVEMRVGHPVDCMACIVGISLQ